MKHVDFIGSYSILDGMNKEKQFLSLLANYLNRIRKGMEMKPEAFLSLFVSHLPEQIYGILL